jgi:hypothetical protein
MPARRTRARSGRIVALAAQVLLLAAVPWCHKKSGGSAALGSAALLAVREVSLAEAALGFGSASAAV